MIIRTAHIFGVSVLLPVVFVASADSKNETKNFAWVQARVEQIAVKPDERPLDQIGWAEDIRDAKRLAKESGRPVFLFTHDGRLNIGRC